MGEQTKDDLLRALAEIHDALDPVNGSAKVNERAYDAFQIARAALAKARGEG